MNTPHPSATGKVSSFLCTYRLTGDVVQVIATSWIDAMLRAEFKLECENGTHLPRYTQVADWKIREIER